VNNSGDTSEILQLLTGAGLGIGVPQVSELIVATWPQASRADATLVAETLVRLAVSYALYPQGNPADVAAAIGRLIAPFVDAALNLD
jgi:hypothetical protein